MDCALERGHLPLSSQLHMLNVPGGESAEAGSRDQAETVRFQRRRFGKAESKVRMKSRRNSWKGSRATLRDGNFVAISKELRHGMATWVSVGHIVTQGDKIEAQQNKAEPIPC